MTMSQVSSEEPKSETRQGKRGKDQYLEGGVQKPEPGPVAQLVPEAHVDDTVIHHEDVQGPDPHELRSAPSVQCLQAGSQQSAGPK